VTLPPWWPFTTSSSPDPHPYQRKGSGLKSALMIGLGVIVALALIGLIAYACAAGSEWMTQ
jgi:hypothetical protein